MSVSIYCPWCRHHQPVKFNQVNFCTKCSHRTDVERDQCDCLMCSPPLLDVPILFGDTLIVEPGSTLDVELPPIPPATPNEVTFAGDAGGLDEYAAALLAGTSAHATTDGVEVMGRLLQKPVLNVVAQPSRIVVRVDDDSNPEFWLQLFISEETVMQWLSAMRHADDAADDGSGIKSTP